MKIFQAINTMPPKMLKTSVKGHIMPDGSVLLMHQKNDKDAGTIEWYTLHKDVFPTVCPDMGELNERGEVEMTKPTMCTVFFGYIGLLFQATHVEWRMPRKDYGSKSVRELGTRIGKFTFRVKSSKPCDVLLMPDLIMQDVVIEYLMVEAQDYEQLKNIGRFRDTSITACYERP